MSSKFWFECDRDRVRREGGHRWLGNATSLLASLNQTVRPPTPSSAAKGWEPVVGFHNRLPTSSPDHPPKAFHPPFLSENPKGFSKAV